MIKLNAFCVLLLGYTFSKVLLFGYTFLKGIIIWLYLSQRYYYLVIPFSKVYLFTP